MSAQHITTHGDLSHSPFLRPEPLANSLLLCGYFAAGTLLVKSAGITARERSMLIPSMAVSAAYAAVAVRTRQVQAVTIVTEPLS
jgi:hypothetical protein